MRPSQRTTVNWTLVLYIVLLTMSDRVMAQEDCYGGGSMAGAIIGTFLVTLALVAVAYLFYKYYWKNKRDKNLVLTTDPENVKDEFAFDNPGFKNEGIPAGAIQRPWPKQNSYATDKSLPNSEGRTFLDDTFPEHNRSSIMVPIWSKDFTGLGFEIAGSMRDGIYVSRVLRGGSAYESGKIHTGDRINSVRISFRNMVYEDALSILSFASPYELQLEIQSPIHNQSNSKDIQSRLANLLSGNINVQRSPGSTLQMGDRKKMTSYDSLDKNWKTGSEEIKHPVIKVKRSRCNSYGDLSTLEKSTKQHHFLKPPGSPNSTLDSSNQSKNTSLKKMLADKIITNSATLEKNKHYQHGQKEYRNSQMTTLERENEKNAKNKMDMTTKIDLRMKNHEIDAIHKPERTKNRNSNDVSNLRASSPPDVVIIKDGGDMYSVKNEKSEVQKKEADPAKKGMKFGIRVLPPNIPDDGTLIGAKSPKYENVKIGGNENGNIVAEIRSIDEVDKNFSSPNNTVTHVDESQKPKTAPVVAKRREKPVAPIPNARVTSQNLNHNNINVEQKPDMINKQTSNNQEIKLEFNRNDDLNSSGIKRDAQGIPQEIPQHMMEAAMYARNNRKTSTDVTSNDKKQSEKDTSSKNGKKSKGKAPSPPDHLKSNASDTSSDTDMANTTQETVVSFNNKKPNMNFTDNFVNQNSSNGYMIQGFIENEKKHANVHQEPNRSDDMILNKSLVNTSTPKPDKIVKRMRPDIPVQKSDDSMSDTIDDVVTYSKKEISDSLNNFFEDSKSNVSSMLDINSEISLNQDSFSSNQNSDIDKAGHSPTTIALNSSDITIHSSPVNEAERKIQDLDENERKASSLGDLSMLEKSEKKLSIKKPSQGTLERAQSLDISAENAKVNVGEKNVTSKKRKSNSVFEAKYYDDVQDDVPINSSESVDQILVHSKEPRLSLNISNIGMDGLNTFQKNRLKKSTEWGNLEDAIISKKGIGGSSLSGSSEITNSSEKINDTPITNGTFVSNALEEESKKLDDEINKLKQISNEVIGDTCELANKVKDSSIMLDSYNKPDAFKNVENLSSFNTMTVEHKPDVQKNKQTMDISNSSPPMKPNFEIGTYVSDPSGTKYKTDTTTIITSSKLSPKMEEKLTMIYDTNIPDDIKVSRHSLVSSLERPKSDLMKKILAQNPVLTNLEAANNTTDTIIDPEIGEHNTGIQYQNVNFDKGGENRTNLTSFTLLNQPDIVNLRVKQNPTIDTQKDSTYQESEFVSNINIGTLPKNESSKINFNMDGNFAPPDKLQTRNYFSTAENVVTITTDGSQPSSIITIESDPSGQGIVENFRNSIEINADTDKTGSDNNADNTQTEPSLYNEIISELRKSKENPVISSSKTYLIDGGTTPYVVETDLPSQKTVTVNVTEDEHGNKIVTQNTEETKSRIVTVMTTTPIEIEQYTFGVIKNPTEADIKRIEEMENDPDVDKRIITEIERQNPHMKLIAGDPSYSNTETMMVNANLSEEETNELLARFKENPHMIISNKIQNPEIVIKETKMIVEESDKPLIKMTQASYKYVDENKPTVKIVKMIESGEDVQPEIVKKTVEKFNKSSDSKDEHELPKDYVTEIEVRTPKTSEKMDEIDFTDYMNDFLSNERAFSSKEKTDSDYYEKRKSYGADFKDDRGQSLDEQKAKRHSDYNLPRNTHIKFRTATYEPQNPTPNRLSWTSDKRLSQIEILKSNFEKSNNGGDNTPSNRPAVMTKPSNIPIKLPEKPVPPQKTSAVSPSKIPVLNSQNQKSASQENLLDKSITFQKGSPHSKLSPSLGNISVTSIKSSSRNPSGK